MKLYNCRINIWKFGVVLYFGALMLIIYSFDGNLQYLFDVAVIIIYLVMMPKKIMNPKNAVFGFYFMWYVVAPLFASRFDTIRIYQNYCNEAYLMCFFTYCSIMIILDFQIRYEKSYNHNTAIEWNDSHKLVIIFLMSLGLFFYINGTGGIELWMSHLSEGYFRRRGSGQYYLLFIIPFLIFSFFEGQKAYMVKSGTKKVIQYVKLFVLIALLFRFIGSKSVVLEILLMIFVDNLMLSEIFSFKTLGVVSAGLMIFLCGLYTRLNEDWGFVQRYALNYFDTFEEFELLIRDFSPDFLTTFYMPFSWPLIKIGILPNSTTFFDFSAYLTAFYSPDTYYIGQGTRQWNIESDMYLNFYFIFGIPLVMLLFSVIASLYNQAMLEGGIWKFIYVSEFVKVLSHLRGGIFLYWYWYLIPLYVCIYYFYRRRTVCSTNR